MATPTPTQAEANTINHNLYAGLAPPTCAADGSPPDTGSIPGQPGSLAAEPAHAPAREVHHRETHREPAGSTARAR